MPFDLTQGAPQRIAIIGAGISGLASAWLLSRHHQVTVYEAAPRLGGHARTVLAGRNGAQPVDTGFIVFNYATYPGLTGMFNALGVPVEKSDMSFGASIGDGRLEYGLRGPGAIFGQRRNLARPAFHGMIRDILTFNAKAEAAAAPGMTIAGLMARLRLGSWFENYYLTPLCGAIWSAPPAGIGAYPAQNLLRFMRNHALLSASGQHQWWTVSGGSAAYVWRLEAALRARGVALLTGTPVTAVRRGADRVEVQGRGDAVQSFDQVIMATHADHALGLLEAPTPAERVALGAIRFQPNRVVLHRDASVMPRARRCWSSWVYQGAGGGSDAAPIAVSYWMNRLQNIPADDPLFVTLNPRRDIPDEAIYDEVSFRHPQFDQPALDAQAKVAALQGQHRTWYAGAWLRNGFHEDGFASAARIARRLVPLKVTP